MAGGYAYTDARIVSDTSATIVAGNRVGLVPFHTFSLWNKYQIDPRWGVGLGVISQTDSFVASDDTVELPGFTRLDGAVFLRVSEFVRAQLNVENLLNARYYATAHANNNITPGGPRTVRAALTANF